MFPSQSVFLCLYVPKVHVHTHFRPDCEQTGHRWDKNRWGWNDLRQTNTHTHTEIHTIVLSGRCYGPSAIIGLEWVVSKWVCVCVCLCLIFLRSSLLFLPPTHSLPHTLYLDPFYTPLPLLHSLLYFYPPSLFPFLKDALSLFVSSFRSLSSVHISAARIDQQVNPNVGGKLLALLGLSARAQAHTQNAHRSSDADCR